MLSEEEYQDTLWKYNNIPKSITGKPRRNLRAVFGKKLHEHELASTYPPFQPLPYQQFFINRSTHELTLLHLIESVQSTKMFTLDTESINIPYQPNKPALIQIQLILPTSYSYVIFVEVWHLPREREPTFELIKLFFNTLFHPDKKIYMWGLPDELINFTEFKLFSREQIYLPENINVQGKFKNYWKDNYPHKPTLNGLTKDSHCKCESCLGIAPNNPWSLQNAMAYKLNIWLDKRYSRSQFNMGLDPQLKHLNSKELEHRQQMTNYAADDCLSMHQLLIELNFFNNQELLNDISDEIELIVSNHQKSPLAPSTNNLSQQPIYELISDDDNDNEREQLINHRMTSFQSPTPSTEQFNASKINNNNNNNYIQTQTFNWNLQSTNVSESLTTSSNHPSTSTQQQLSLQERKRVHNHTCTLKQRRRAYQNEIICKNIDWRFSITNIKQILQQQQINFSLINTTKPPATRRTLFIGIKDATLLSTYRTQIQENGLFTTDHYKQWKYDKRKSTKHYPRRPH